MEDAARRAGPAARRTARLAPAARRCPDAGRRGAAGIDAGAGDRCAPRRRRGAATRAERRDWLARLRAALVQAAERAAHRLAELRQLAARCTELADIDYEFLYDRDRHLLAIGYNVADRRLDASFYDLLASEARLASFVAIAQGKLRRSTGSASAGC